MQIDNFVVNLYVEKSPTVMMGTLNISRHVTNYRSYVDLERKLENYYQNMITLSKLRIYIYDFNHTVLTGIIFSCEKVFAQVPSTSFTLN